MKKIKRLIKIFFVYPLLDIISGAINAKKNLFENIKDYYYEKRLRINTWGSYEKKENKSSYGDEIRYIQTHYSEIKKMIDYLKLNKDDVFIDFGCGKGAVIFMTATQKIKKVIGIELRKSIMEIAKKNLKNLKF